MNFVDKKLAFRLAMVALILFAMYVGGIHAEILAMLGVLFIVLIFLRGKMWRLAEHILENHLPFTKGWPEWAEKVLLFLIFILFYIVLKEMLYFVLGLFGIDITKIIMNSFSQTP